MGKKNVWRLVVTVVDEPQGHEDYLTEERVRGFVESHPLAGVEIRVMDAKEMGTL